MPWLSGEDFKVNVPDMPNSAPLLIIVRDTGSGRVTLGPDGLPRIRYWPCAHDREAMMQVWVLAVHDRVSTPYPE